MPIKVVFVCLEITGHLQVPIAIGKALLFRDPKNEIFFVVDEQNESKIKAKCTAFKTLTFNSPNKEKFESPTADEEKYRVWTMGNRERFKAKGGTFAIKMINTWKARAKKIQDLIIQTEPDLVIVENLFNLPFIMAMKYKWAFIVSTNPLRIANQHDYPPMGSGVSEDWQWFTDVLTESQREFRANLDEFYQEYGLERKPVICNIQPSPWFNVCIFPRPLNYFDVEKGEGAEGKWIQLSSSILKDEVNEFIQAQGWSNEGMPGKELLTKEFLTRPKDCKLVLFSMGTMVSNNRKVMDMLIAALARCRKHKFIVSKGKDGDDWKLPANCVGANSLNQLEILKSGHLDAFISHMGNNSFTEACYYGVPMIAIPAMGDQYDNSERLERFGLGKRILLQNVTSEELCKAIDYVTGSEEVKRKVEEVSEVVRKDDAMDRLCDLIEETCSRKDP